ncbi:efflux RND transporter periplasmic adaptor subunit [Rhodoferax lacus]|uniref:Efflux RND transporter periplasmic adaptor subunit n=1 Tax=Rhodoferax lacus TaxID=2184758 RepID=A0A3E1R8Z9_9BURK|nr:efflux RND transporter periplasmic adaptor subunit [Rhodoferax lacus]RFO95836.1 efflux RND transporter periplasmic adaptor subunit [Rhodoferax lacus]
MKQTNISIAAVALGLLAAVATAWPALAQAGGVPTVAVQSSATAGSYVLDGVVQAARQSTVAAQASGRIASFNAKAGDKVRAGQLLATIDDREAQVGVQRSQAQINQADAELRNAQAQMERTRNLQAQGFVSKAAFDTANTQYQAAQAQREQATASARQSGIAQGFTRVSAPIDGWVLQTFAQAGDLAVPGTPLLVVYAPQPLRAVVQVPASRSLAVRQAKQTTVWVDNSAGAAQAITPLNRLEVPASDPVSQTTEWRLDLPAQAAAALVPGQQVRVGFVSADAATANAAATRLLVPASAIARRGELTAVYVQDKQRFALRAVRLGADRGSQGVEVLAGLQAGERVATDTVAAAQPDAAPAAQ